MKRLVAVCGMGSLLVAGCAAVGPPAVVTNISAHLGALPDARRDDFCHRLAAQLGVSGMQRLPLADRLTMLQVLREGVVSARDRRLYDQLSLPAYDELYARQMASLRRHKLQRAWQRHFQTLLVRPLREGPNGLLDCSPLASANALPMCRAVELASTATTEVRFSGSRIPVPAQGQPQWLTNTLSGLAVLAAQRRFSSPRAVQRLLATPRVTGTDGRLVHLPGTTLFRPGFGNFHPSASHLFRWAQHTDVLIIAYTLNRPRAEARLRPLDHYLGIPVPPSLQGKIFAVGRPGYFIQDYRAGTAAFIAQLEQIRRQARRYGFDLTTVNAIGHSQGNIEIALARAVLAAYGHPQVIRHHIGIAPALRGCLMNDDASWLYQAGALATMASGKGSLVGYHGVQAMDPDLVRASLPVFLRSTVTVSFLGLIGHGQRPSYRNGVMHLTALLTAAGLNGSGTDGLIDLRIRSFSAAPHRLVIRPRSQDHFAIVMESPDPLLAALDMPLEDTTWPLKQLATKRRFAAIRQR